MLFVAWFPLLLVNLAACAGPSSAQEPEQASSVPSMPSEEEIGALLHKASEYVETYKQTFIYAKPSLDKAVTPGFYKAGMELSAQASSSIAAITQNGSSAYGLVVLITILDDMSLNASKASAATTLVALDEKRANPNNHAMNDFRSLAEVGKNCYDISELLVHTTLRYIGAEETALLVLLKRQKH